MPRLPWEAMEGMAVTQQSTMPLIRSNKIQETEDKDASKEVVPEEAFTKDVVEEADASNNQHTYH